MRVPSAAASKALACSSEKLLAVRPQEGDPVSRADALAEQPGCPGDDGSLEICVAQDPVLEAQRRLVGGSSGRGAPDERRDPFRPALS